MNVLEQVVENEADEWVSVRMEADMLMRWKCDANEPFFPSNAQTLSVLVSNSPGAFLAWGVCSLDNVQAEATVWFSDHYLENRAKKIIKNFLNVHLIYTTSAATTFL